MQGNLLKGFETYVSMKTSKIQSGQKKQKVENYERLFSLSSVTSKISQILEDTLSGDPIARAEVQNLGAKRNRPRMGKTKSGGKSLMRDEGEDDEDNDSADNDDGDDSIDESVSKSRVNNKKHRIKKSTARKG
jgi:hypothetical protein